MLTRATRSFSAPEALIWPGAIALGLSIGAAVALWFPDLHFSPYEVTMLLFLLMGVFFWTRRGFAHPLAWMPVLFCAYFLVGVQNWVKPSAHLAFRSHVDATSVLSLATLGIACFCVGVLLTTSGARHERGLRAVSRFDIDAGLVARRAGYLLFGVGLFGLLLTLPKVGVPLLHPAVRAEGNHGIGAICTYALVPAALLLTMDPRLSSTRRDIAIVCGCSFLLLLLAYRAPIILLIGSFLLMRVMQGQIRERSMAIAGVVLILLAMVFFTYRAHAIGRDVTGPEIVPSGPFNFAPSLFPLYIGFAREGVAIFGHLVEIVPSLVPHTDGTVQSSMFHIHPGATSPREYVYQIAMGTDAARTTYTPTILGGPYLDFGAVGVAVEMFLIGLVAGSLYRLAAAGIELWRVLPYSYWAVLVAVSIHSGLLDDLTLVIVPLFVAFAVLITTVPRRRPDGAWSLGLRRH